MDMSSSVVIVRRIYSPCETAVRYTVGEVSLHYSSTLVLARLCVAPVKTDRTIVGLYEAKPDRRWIVVQAKCVAKGQKHKRRSSKGTVVGEIQITNALEQPRARLDAKKSTQSVPLLLLLTNKFVIRNNYCTACNECESTNAKAWKCQAAL